MAFFLPTSLAISLRTPTLFLHITGHRRGSRQRFLYLRRIVDDYDLLYSPRSHLFRRRNQFRLAGLRCIRCDHCRCDNLCLVRALLDQVTLNPALVAFLEANPFLLFAGWL
jgi:hypothetical protein